MDFMKLDIQLFASGTISLGTSGYLAGQIIWSSSSNGTAANSSNVTATLQLRRTNSYTTTGTWTGNININGNNANISYYGSISSSWVSVSTRTVTVAHNSDGSKTCSISGSGTGPSGTSLSGNTVTGSANVTLDKIARQATITSAPNFNDEANPTINYSNPAKNSVSSLQACITNSTGSIIYAAYRDISKTGTSYTFELTESERTALRNATPNSNSLTVRFYVKTVISGSTYYSYSAKTMTIINANPVFYNFDFEDINATTLALTNNSQIFVSGFSTAQVTIDETDKATAQKGASIVKYQFSNGAQNVDINYSDSEDVTGYLENIESGTNVVYAIDSRGNSTPVNKLASQTINYTGVYIDKSQSSFERNNNQVGDTGVLTLAGTFWNGNFGDVQNSIQNVIYRFKKTEDSTYITGTTTITLTVSNNDFSFTGQIASDNLDTTWDLESSYNLEVEIVDELSVASASFILNSAIPTMSIDKEGVGIMCAYDQSVGGMLQVGGVPYNQLKIETEDILLTNKTATLNADGWRDIANDKQVTFKKGVHYLIFVGWLTNAAATGIGTIRITVDGTGYERQSIPINNTLITSATLVTRLVFNSTTTVTLNMQAYCNQNFKVNYAIIKRTSFVYE